MLLFVAIAENDRIVHGQGQLQYDAHGVRHKGYGTKQKMGADIDDRRGHKGEDHHGDLGIGAGRKNQHGQHNDHHENQYHQHLLGNQARKAESYFAVDGGILIPQQRFDRIQGALADRRVCRIGKGHVDQRFVVPIVLSGFRKLSQGNTLKTGYFIGIGLRLIGGDVPDHHLGCGVGDEFLFHDGQSLPGLRILGQIERDIIFYLYPAGGDHREDQRCCKQPKDPVSVIYDKAGKPGHERFILGFHTLISPICKTSRVLPDCVFLSSGISDSQPGPGS